MTKHVKTEEEQKCIISSKYFEHVPIERWEEESPKDDKYHHADQKPK
jgi:hypothetical protein